MPSIQRALSGDEDTLNILFLIDMMVENMSKSQTISGEKQPLTFINLRMDLIRCGMT